MINAEGLTKYFETFLAVDSISLNVPNGKVLVLLGPNGAGKTTTVRMLTSILRPSRGWAKVAGYNIVTEADQVRASVGVLTEHHGLYVRMNAEEYLNFYGQLYGLPAKIRMQRIDELLSKFGLAEVRRKRLGEFSKGMRQKLALVRALIHSPKVLLLDEPTSAMDPESARLVREAIKGLQSDERTILLCTHNLTEAEELADQLAIIRRGKILFNGRVEELKDQQLGNAEYVANLSGELDGWNGGLPTGVRVSDKGKNFLRFQVDNPEETNPILISELLLQSLLVVSFQQVPRSLETAYLSALQHAQEEE
jgi:ABC-2 type transport system ATP-binding protein